MANYYKTTLADLMAGNQRFANGQLTHPRRTPQDRQLLVDGQQPKAAVIACSDSRYTPTVIFDQGLGDLFEIRIAGNGLTPQVLASVQFAVDKLHVPLMLVLGHTSCGAVQAALIDGPLTPELTELVAPIRALANGFDPSQADQVARLHARHVASQLTRSRLGGVHIAAGIYSLSSGKVELL